MPTPRPSARGDDGMRAKVDKLAKDLAQHRRETARMNPISAALGGVLGVARCIPVEFGSYFAGTWGTLYANNNQWTISTLSGTAPAVTIQSVGDPSNGLDSIVVPTSGWYSLKLQFYVTFSNGAAQPTSVYAGIVPPRGDTNYHPVESTFPIMSGAIPGVMPDVSGAKRSTGVVGTDPLWLTAGDAVALHVSWDAAQTLWPNADDRPRCLVDVTAYSTA